jgi:integrase
MLPVAREPAAPGRDRAEVSQSPLRASTRSSPAPAVGLGSSAATCHELRHTCLTRLREAGMALEAVQAQAGHRSIESTRIYLHLTNDWLAGECHRAAQLIDADHAAVTELLALQAMVAR